ncbi:hypothetical protein BDB01DRAFT_786517 [Pilobolus umbonatus]|nr:hypothetical protein BDB01DRAFT_786517 [Pilobolus umbonatus]
MLQFWNDWKRKGNNKMDEELNTEMARTYSMISDNSTPSNWSIDWNETKRTLSFKEDYVSFPSLETMATADSQCSN